MGTDRTMLLKPTLPSWPSLLCVILFPSQLSWLWRERQSPLQTQACLLSTSSYNTIWVVLFVTSICAPLSWNARMSSLCLAFLRSPSFTNSGGAQGEDELPPILLNCQLNKGTVLNIWYRRKPGFHWWLHKGERQVTPLHQTGWRYQFSADFFG